MIGGWPETGFLRDPSLRWEDSGKNPVSLMVREGPETGFLRDTLLQPTNSGKNPVSSNFVLIPVAAPSNRSSAAMLQT